MIMKTTRLLSLAALGLSLFFAATGQAAQPANLLKHADLPAGVEAAKDPWQFSLWLLTDEQKSGDQIQWGVATQDDSSRALQIRTTVPFKSQLWWQQRLPVSGSGHYHFSVKAKVTTQSSATRAQTNVGLYFLGEGNRWLTFVPLKSTAKPGDGWVELSGKIVAPEEATVVTARLGVEFTGETEVLFKDPVLTLVP